MGASRADDPVRFVDRWSYNYLRFTRVLIAVATLTIFATVALQLLTPPYLISEVAAQLLLLGVLIAAVRGGAGWGMAVAMAASLFYVLLRTEVFSATDVGFADTAIIATRLVAFGLIGVVGGEVFSRLKHGAGVSLSTGIDHWTGLRDGAWGAGVVRDALVRWETAGEPFVVCLLTVSPQSENTRASRRRSIMRGVGKRIRSDIRMSDAVAWLDDGRFLIVLPKTTLPGAQSVAARLTKDLRHTFSLEASALGIELLDPETNRPRIDDLLLVQLGSAATATV